MLKPWMKKVICTHKKIFLFMAIPRSFSNLIWHFYYKVGEQNYYVDQITAVFSFQCCVYLLILLLMLKLRTWSILCFLGCSLTVPFLLHPSQVKQPLWTTTAHRGQLVSSVNNRVWSVQLAVCSVKCISHNVQVRDMTWTR